MASRAVAAVILIRSLTSRLGEVRPSRRLLRAACLTTRVVVAWPIPVPEAISATSTMVASMTRAAAAKNAEVATGKEEEGTGLLAAARPEEAGTPSATSPAESLVPEEAGTASTVAAAAGAEAATVSAAGETTRKPSAGVAPTTSPAVVPVPSALPRGTRPDARLTP